MQPAQPNQFTTLNQLEQYLNLQRQLGALQIQTHLEEKQAAERVRTLDQLKAILAGPGTYTEINQKVSHWFAKAHTTPEGRVYYTSFQTQTDYVHQSTLKFQILCKNKDGLEEALPIVKEKVSGTVNYSEVKLPPSLQEELKCQTLQEWLEKTVGSKLVTSRQISNKVEQAKAAVVTALLPVSVEDERAHFVPSFNPDTGENWVFLTWTSNGTQWGFSMIEFPQSKDFYSIQDSTDKTRGQHNWSATPLSSLLMGQIEQNAQLLEAVENNSLNVAMVRIEKEPVYRGVLTGHRFKGGGAIEEEEGDTSASAPLNAIMGDGHREEKNYGISNYQGKFKLIAQSAVFLSIKPLPIDVKNLHSTDVEDYTQKVEQMLDITTQKGEWALYGPTTPDEILEAMLEKIQITERPLTYPCPIYKNTPYLDYTGKVLIKEINTWRGKSYQFEIDGKEVQAIFSNGETQPVLFVHFSKHSIGAHYPVIVDYGNEGKTIRLFDYNEDSLQYDFYEVPLETLVFDLRNPTRINVENIKNYAIGQFKKN